MFTGSGMPMRFADADGTMIDVYQATTQMTDESGQTYPLHDRRAARRALGPQGYYGVFTANMHTDHADPRRSDAIVASAHGARRAGRLGAADAHWLDGRNGSSFGALTWNGGTLTFTISVGAGRTGCARWCPTTSAGRTR